MILVMMQVKLMFQIEIIIMHWILQSEAKQKSSWGCNLINWYYKTILINNTLFSKIIYNYILFLAKFVNNILLAIII